MSSKAAKSNASHISDKSPFEKFRELTTRVVSVPRAEIQKREVEYKEQRKIKSQHRHR